ncbi:putative membrane protein [Mycobacteroides abscessus MAB_091912_2446]|uniref:Putative membrane protein n=1 Tax=Mycobacteroides abscessus MAB_091912_2446 TaxID=1335414 RepID=A0A829M9H8_9MYCO|nr:putative membrane protein [Mycobacteroides abscessus MAB_091912_2446]
MLVIGVAVPATQIGNFPVLSVIGFVVMFGAAVFAIIGSRRSESNPRDRERRAGSRVRKNRAAGSFAQRMEERFRRRFDN